MYCPNCGHAVRNNENYCMFCGARLNNPCVHDGDSELLCMIAGLILPLLGFVLYFVYEYDRPNRAKVALKGALIGFGARLAISVIIKIITIAFKLVAFGSFFGFML